MKTETHALEIAQGWRVGHIGRDGMYYDELRNGRWRRLRLDGEMLMGRAHHVIYFRNCAEWKSYPEWAQGRRDEIVDRIKTAFRMPDYEYDGEAILSESDAVAILESAGGLSKELCKQAGCSRRAIRRRVFCIYHAFQSELWRPSAVPGPGVLAAAKRPNDGSARKPAPKRSSKTPKRRR
jgi:hypothetical protein